MTVGGGKAADCFTATHHALLLAWMLKAVIKRVGEENVKAVICGAEQRYREEHRHCMALLAQADRRVLSTADHPARGEWTADAGKIEQALVEKGADVWARTHSTPGTRPGRRTS